MLPAPTITFTIPSICDSLTLDCRVYHPQCLTSPTTVAHITQWRKRAAIMAHPYAPMGGCYDDPVVGIAAAVMLKQGYIVCTLNFRGAFGSKGRTSWTSKPEQSDYISVLGFLTYYMHHLTTYVHESASDPHLSQAASNIDTVASKHVFITPDISTFPDTGTRPKPLLILGGYSYGSMIVSALSPIIDSLILPFQRPEAGSAYAEIRLRARNLAAEQNILIQRSIAALLAASGAPRRYSLAPDSSTHSPSTRGSLTRIRAGGNEDLSRASSDSARSRHSLSLEAAPEMLRQGMEKVKALASSRKERSGSQQDGNVDQVPMSISKSPSKSSLTMFPPDESTDSTAETNNLQPIAGIVEQHQFAYLLISPIQGFIKNLASMWSLSRDANKDKQSHGLRDSDIKFTIDPTLAIFGDDDTFVSIKNFRAWCTGLKMREDSSIVSSGGPEGGRKLDSRTNFSFKEVHNAGHFWIDDEAALVLEEEVEAFALRL